MKLRPPPLASDKDAFLQEQRGNWAKLPHGQEGGGAPVPGLGSPPPDLKPPQASAPSCPKRGDDSPYFIGELL